MTPQEIIDYYPNLLIVQYINKPRAFATVEALVEPVLMPVGGNVVTDNEGNPVFDLDGNVVLDGPVTGLLPLLLQQAFNLSTAVGKQLDTLGKYIGAPRNGFTFSGTITLNDGQYRQLLLAVIARNHLRADLSSIQAFFASFFSGVFLSFDHGNMRMSFYYLMQTGVNVVAEFFVKLGLLPRPLAVGDGLPIYAFPNNNFFGFRTYFAPAPAFVAPFNSYSSYLTNRPWLTYAYAIII